jgi:hypothetical protein
MSFVVVRSNGEKYRILKFRKPNEEAAPSHKFAGCASLSSPLWFSACFARAVRLIDSSGRK